MEDKFWNKVSIKTDDTCWEWQSYINYDGYGIYRINNKAYRVHRLAYELYHNRPIIEGMIILHSCDNRKCCNPHHLSEGTKNDNSLDMINKGRSCKGENIKTSKLKKDDVIKIRNLYNENYTYTSLATQYNVSVYTIYCIVQKKTWRHIE